MSCGIIIILLSTDSSPVASLISKLGRSKEGREPIPFLLSVNLHAPLSYESPKRRE